MSDSQRFRIYFLDGGQRIPAECTFPTHEAALAWAEEHLAVSLRRGDYGPPSAWVAGYGILDTLTDEETRHAVDLREAE